MSFFGERALQLRAVPELDLSVSGGAALKKGARGMGSNLLTGFPAHQIRVQSLSHLVTCVLISLQPAPAQLGGLGRGRWGSQQSNSGLCFQAVGTQQRGSLPFPYSICAVSGRNKAASISACHSKAPAALSLQSPFSDALRAGCPALKALCSVPKLCSASLI